MSSTPEQSRSISRKINVKPAEPLLSLVPISVLTDSYKTTHYMQYPESRKMVAVCDLAVSEDLTVTNWLCPSKIVVFQYAEFRNGFDKDVEDTRLVFYGIRYLLEGFIARQWTQQDVNKAATFFRLICYATCQMLLP